MDGVMAREIHGFFVFFITLQINAWNSVNNNNLCLSIVATSCEFLLNIEVIAMKGNVG
jgi:hypothetical protein